MEAQNESMKMADPVLYETNKSLAKRDLELYMPQLIQLMNWNCEVESILDYGCGAGSVAYEYLLPIANEKNANITGIDISEEMIQFANNNYKHPRIQYFVGNVMCDNHKYKEMFKENSFDKIFSTYVIHFIHDHRKAFKLLHKILKPKGELGFTVVGKKGFGFITFKALAQDPKWSKYMPGIENWIAEWAEPDKDPEHVLRNSLESAGLKVKYLQTNRSIYTGPLEAAVNLYVSLNPFSKRIPNHLIEDFREFIRDLLMKTYKTNMDKYPIECDQDYDMLVCLAEKS